MGVYRIPGSIDSTGDLDVTAQLQAFIDSVPDGSTILPAGATPARYRCEGSLKLLGRNDLTFDLGGLVTTFHETHGAGTASQVRVRSSWFMYDCQRLVLRGMKTFGMMQPEDRFKGQWSSTAAYQRGDVVRVGPVADDELRYRALRDVPAGGPQPVDGPDWNRGWAWRSVDDTLAHNYLAVYEAQHGIWFGNCRGVLIDRCEFAYLMGDGLYFGYRAAGRTLDVVVVDTAVHHINRQAITPICVERYHHLRGSVDNWARHAIDAEAAVDNPLSGGDHLVWDGVTFTCQAPAGGPLGFVNIQSNTQASYDHWKMLNLRLVGVAGLCGLKAPVGRTRRGHVWAGLVGNRSYGAGTCTAPKGLFNVTRFENAVFRAFAHPVQANRCMRGVQFTSSIRVRADAGSMSFPGAQLNVAFI